MFVLLIAVVSVPAAAAPHHGRQVARIRSATCAQPLRNIAPQALLKTWVLNTTRSEDENANPGRHTVLEIPIFARYRALLCKNHGARLDVRVLDPSTGVETYLPASVETISVSAKRLRMVVNGPVSEGSVLSLERGLFLSDGRANLAGEIELKKYHFGKRRKFRRNRRQHRRIDRYNRWVDNYNRYYDSPLISPLDATAWFKAFAPLAPEQFLTYGRSQPERGTRQPFETDEVFANLEAHLQKKVEVGLLDEVRAAEVLAMYYDPAVQDIFTDQYGQLNTHLLASTLATSGTVLDGTLEVFLGDNDTGAPARVYYGTPTRQEYDLEVFITYYGEMHVIVRSDAAYVPFEILATILGHEALHQDVSVTRNEELIASVAQYVAYAQQILADPDLAQRNLYSIHFNNTGLLLMMNSGRAGYPHPGHDHAPVIQTSQLALPGSSSAFESFGDWRLRTFYSHTPAGNSPGNAFLQKVAAQISTGDATEPLDFDAGTLKLFDDVRALSPQQWVEVSQALGLSFDMRLVFSWLFGDTVSESSGSDLISNGFGI